MAATTAVETAAQYKRPGTRDAYTSYVITILWCVLLLRFVDLQILSVLLEPIRQEFELSDSQLGLLTGFAFALFYGTLGIPIAWAADRYNRRNIIAASLALWSLMTALSGAATGFLTLFLARVGVGVGEAGGIPPAYSLVSDYVRKERRPAIFAILNTAVPIGVLVGLIVGGWVSQLFGWRAAFVVVGAPGLLLALIVRLTIKEPPRSQSSPATPPQTTTLRETFAYLLQKRSYVQLVLGSSILTLGAVGSGSWIPSFFVRVHGLSVGQAGTWLGLIYGIGGLIGVLGGGILCDRMARRTGDPRWNVWIPAAATFLILPTAVFVYLWPTPGPALAVQFFGAIFLHVWMGPCYGTIQTLAGPPRRAMAAAVNLLMINLIAFGMGPLIIGIASDTFSSTYGEDSLRYAILGVVLISYAWATVHFLLAGRRLRADLADT